MAKELRLRRGTTAEHSSFTGANGEATLDTTKKTIVVHDGATVGGLPLAREDLSNVPAGSVSTDMLASSAVTSGKIADGAVGTNDLANGAVTTDKLADGAVTNAKMASGAAVANIGFTPANSTATVNLTGSQTVQGVKTFTNGLRFGDGSSQTTTALKANAEASLGAVGTYALCSLFSGTAGVLTPGSTRAGSDLRYFSIGTNSSAASPALAGTWRVMGYCAGLGEASLFLRIS